MVKKEETLLNRSNRNAQTLKKLRIDITDNKNKFIRGSWFGWDVNAKTALGLLTINNKKSNLLI